MQRQRQLNELGAQSGQWCCGSCHFESRWFQEIRDHITNNHPEKEMYIIDLQNKKRLSLPQETRSVHLPACRLEMQPSADCYSMLNPTYTSSYGLHIPVYPTPSVTYPGYSQHESTGEAESLEGSVVTSDNGAHSIQRSLEHPLDLRKRQTIETSTPSFLPHSVTAYNHHSAITTTTHTVNQNQTSSSTKNKCSIYICTYCKYETEAQQDIQQHLYIYHNVKLFATNSALIKCNYCDLFTSCNRCILFHRIEFHGELLLPSNHWHGLQSFSDNTYRCPYCAVIASKQQMSLHLLDHYTKMYDACNCCRDKNVWTTTHPVPRRKPDPSPPKKKAKVTVPRKNTGKRALNKPMYTSGITVTPQATGLATSTDKPLNQAITQEATCNVQSQSTEKGSTGKTEVAETEQADYSLKKLFEEYQENMSMVCKQGDEPNPDPEKNCVNEVVVGTDIVPVNKNQEKTQLLQEDGNKNTEAMDASNTNDNSNLLSPDSNNTNLDVMVNQMTDDDGSEKLPDGLYPQHNQTTVVVSTLPVSLPLASLETYTRSISTIAVKKFYYDSSRKSHSLASSKSQVTLKDKQCEKTMFLKQEDSSALAENLLSNNLAIVATDKEALAEPTAGGYNQESQVMSELEHNTETAAHTDIKEEQSVKEVTKLDHQRIGFMLKQKLSAIAPKLGKGNLKVSIQIAGKDKIVVQEEAGTLNCIKSSDEVQQATMREVLVSDEEFVRVQHRSEISEPKSEILESNTDGMKICTVSLTRLNEDEKVNEMVTASTPAELASIIPDYQGLDDQSYVVCPYCPKVLTVKRLHAHVLFHGSKAKKACKHCDFSTHFRWVLQEHSALHKNPPELHGFQLSEASWQEIKLRTSPDDEDMENAKRLINGTSAASRRQVARKTGSIKRPGAGISLTPVVALSDFRVDKSAAVRTEDFLHDLLSRS